MFYCIFDYTLKQIHNERIKMAENKSSTKSKLGAIARKKENRKQVALPKPVIQEAKVPAKVGRPTFKKSGVKYVKVYTQIPDSHRDAIKMSLLTHFKGVYKTQDEIINAAISEFLEKYKLV